MGSGFPRSMKIVHISSDYAKQKLYKQLVEAVGASVSGQTVYVPVRTRAEVGGNVTSHARVEVRYNHILSPSDRFFFRNKVRKVSQWIEKSHVDWSQTVIHAHFLYSDGAVALKLHKKYKVPFCVTVRNTDINLFARLRPDLRYVAREVLERASYIIFPNYAYKDRLLSEVGIKHSSDLESKFMVIPNGIDSRWLEGKPVIRDTVKDSNIVKLLFVGDDTRNKNLDLVIEAANSLGNDSQVTLSVVGRNKPIKNRIGPNIKLINYGRLGFDRLREEYIKSDVLVVPSFKETFGLAYLECLSCGTPVIHARGEGISGYWRENGPVGVVDPECAQSLVACILDMLNRKFDKSLVRSKLEEEFSWPVIAHRLVAVYKAMP